ncbi:MAG: GNAT family N-acetyltransferase [Pseudomonadota bacterium]
MTKTTQIRPLAKSDYDQWRPLWDGYNKFYERVGPTALPEEVTSATWSRFFDAYEPMNAFVAERDGRLVGLVHYIFHRNTTMLGPICYLQDLFTDASTRGQGIGRALIQAVYDRAAEVGSPRVYWLTHETNHTAMTLYDKVATRSGFLHYMKNI